MQITKTSHGHETTLRFQLKTPPAALTSEARTFDAKEQRYATLIGLRTAGEIAMLAVMCLLMLFLIL